MQDGNFFFIHNLKNGGLAHKIQHVLYSYFLKNLRLRGGGYLTFR